jgi:orotidine-5'-phosphate decarboxylase
MKKNVIVALDGMTIHDSFVLAAKLVKHPLLWGFKVNDLLLRSGTTVLKQLKAFGGVFADAKLFDIPNTMTNCVKAMAQEKTDIISVHLQPMYSPPAEYASLLAGVTILTSNVPVHLPEDLPEYSTLERHLDAAVKNGYGYVVCSARNIHYFKPHLGNLKIICPGIRPTWADLNDQKAVATPQQAVDAGADLIVLGRPITQAEDPYEAMDCLFGDTVPTGEKLRNEIVSLYPCPACGKHTIVQKGNHHPWCSCGYDQFDWARGHQDITRAEAERLKKELDG